MNTKADTAAKAVVSVADYVAGAWVFSYCDASAEWAALSAEETATRWLS